MDDKGNPVKDGQSEEKWSWSGPQAIGLFIFVVVCIGAYALWHASEREEISRRNDVELNFTHAPDTIPVAVPSRFVLQVNGPERRPVAERSVHVIITPQTKAEILSMTGPSGLDSASVSHQAWGRSDSAGNVSVLIRATEPGELTIAAADSLSSSAEGTSIQVFVR